MPEYATGGQAALEGSQVWFWPYKEDFVSVSDGQLPDGPGEGPEETKGWAFQEATFPVFPGFLGPCHP